MKKSVKRSPPSTTNSSFLSAFQQFMITKKPAQDDEKPAPQQ